MSSTLLHLWFYGKSFLGIAGSLIWRAAGVGFNFFRLKISSEGSATSPAIHRRDREEATKGSARGALISTWRAAVPILEDVLKEALDLNATDRAVLAQELLASIDPGETELTESEVERLWVQEAQRRLAEHSSGRNYPIASADVASKAEKLAR
jgi:hypothetical protein